MAHRYVVTAPELPAWSVPISHAVVAGQHCYISGQLAVDRTGAFQPGTVRAEGELAFRNLFAVLAAAAFAKADLVFVEIAMSDLAELPQVNVLFAELFPEARRPARTVYQAAALPYGAKIKVHGVAVREPAS
jgi:2-iminobutanoate/2-iminopropanoate deaminase